MIWPTYIALGEGWSLLLFFLFPLFSSFLFPSIPFFFSALFFFQFPPVSLYFFLSPFVEIEVGSLVERCKFSQSLKLYLLACLFTSNVGIRGSRAVSLHGWPTKSQRRPCRHCVDRWQLKRHSAGESGVPASAVWSPWQPRWRHRDSDAECERRSHYQI